jgi:hypothetical protein
LEHVSTDRYEYTPDGKSSMVRGGIGAIRLGDKQMGSERIYFLGASSNGIAHEGIPVALPGSEYRRLIHPIKDFGGCRARLVGTLRTITDELPKFHFGPSIPRYCFFAEEATPAEQSGPVKLLTTTAIMFGLNHKEEFGTKAWTFCTFDPGAEAAVQTAASWLYDYAARLAGGGETYIQTYIGTYIKEQTNVAGDKIDVHGSGNTIVNRSTVSNAFNRVKAAHSEDIAKALLDVEAAITHQSVI